MQENHKYNICMFIATIFFGMTYVLTKICLNYSTELHIISFRFLIAFVISLIFLQRKIFPLKIKEILYSLILSVLLFMVFITMTIGVKYTTATNASFLISLSVIFIPFFSLNSLGWLCWCISVQRQCTHIAAMSVSPL